MCGCVANVLWLLCCLSSLCFSSTRTHTRTQRRVKIATVKGATRVRVTRRKGMVADSDLPAAAGAMRERITAVVGRTRQVAAAPGAGGKPASALGPMTAMCAAEKEGRMRRGTMLMGTRIKEVVVVGVGLERKSGGVQTVLAGVHRALHQIKETVVVVVVVVVEGFRVGPCLAGSSDGCSGSHDAMSACSASR